MYAKNSIICTKERWWLNECCPSHTKCGRGNLPVINMGKETNKQYMKKEIIKEFEDFAVKVEGSTEKQELELIVELMNKWGVNRLGQVEVRLSQIK